MLLKSLVHACSPTGARRRLSVMIVHRVLDRPDLLFPSQTAIARFDQILGWVRRWYHVMPLDEAVAGLRGGGLPARAMAISFDNGSAEIALNAAPILQRHGMTATSFVATSFLAGGRMWNDTIVKSIRRGPGDTLDPQPQGLGCLPTHTMVEQQTAVIAGLRAVKHRLDDLMMRIVPARSLLRHGMQVGDHTPTRPILSKTDGADAHREIRGSKQALEVILSRPASLFAYPNGKSQVDFEARHATMVREASFEDVLHRRGQRRHRCRSVPATPVHPLGPPVYAFRPAPVAQQRSRHRGMRLRHRAVTLFQGGAARKTVKTIGRPVPHNRPPPPLQAPGRSAECSAHGRRCGHPTSHRVPS